MTDREIIRSAVALTLEIIREAMDESLAPGELPVIYTEVCYEEVYSKVDYLELAKIIRNKIENRRKDLRWDFDCPEILSHSSCGWRGWRQDLDGDRTICPRCGRKRDNVQENVTE